MIREPAAHLGLETETSKVLTGSDLFEKEFIVSLQVRLSQSDTRLYDPNRDIAHNFKFVVTKVAGFLEDRHWPELHKILDMHNVTMEQLGEACRAYMIFVATTAEHPGETIQQGLERSGWLHVPESAKIAHQAYIGLVMTGMWYYAARAASLGGDTSIDAKTLVDEGERVARRMKQSWCRRKLSRLFHSARKFNLP
jgi:hypothetical protein